MPLFRKRKITTIRSDVLSNHNLYDYLAYLYKGYNILSYKERFKFPLIVFRAPKKQRYNLDSVLGKLYTEQVEEIDIKLRKKGQAYFKRLLEAHEVLWDGTTYRMITLESQGQLKLTCALGRYYDVLKTCEVLEYELLTKFGEKKPQSSDFSSFIDKLVLRRNLHSKGNPVVMSLGRSAAIGISTLIIFVENSKYKALIRKRSSRVPVGKNLLHAIPSFMFQPAINSYHEEYSVRHNIYREYLEEVFDRKDVERPNKEFGFDFFYEDPNLKYILDLEKEGKAKFYTTGIVINLFNLKPEICTLLLITEPEWILNQRRGKKVKNHQLDIIKINWEFEYGAGLQDAKFEKIASIDLTENLVMPDNLLKPENFVPPGAAALKLGIEIAREELGFQIQKKTAERI